MKLKKLTQKDRYGNTVTYEYEGDTKQVDPTALMKHQMDKMYEVPEMSAPEVGMDGYDHPGEPKGSDTVPAWLTPGEFVVNAEAMRDPQNAAMVEQINNEGREIQAMQGGSIPSYHDNGGYAPIASVSSRGRHRMKPGNPALGSLKDHNIKYADRKYKDYGTVDTVAYWDPVNFTFVDGPGPGIRTIRQSRDHPDNVGYRRNTTEVMDAFGGFRPESAYKAEGGYQSQRHSYITDDVLDALKHIESSGNPNAVNKRSGAAGAYQWMPHLYETGDIGFGVPREPFDPFDEEVARDRARTYLQGIEARHPDWSKEDVLRAYNWGVGNVRKHKKGTRKDVPREAQEYPHKILRHLSEQRGHETYFDNGGLISVSNPPVPWEEEEDVVDVPFVPEQAVPELPMNMRGPTQEDVKLRKIEEAQRVLADPGYSAETKQRAQMVLDGMDTTDPTMGIPETGEVSKNWKLNEDGEGEFVGLNPEEQPVNLATALPNLPGQDIPMGELPEEEVVPQTPEEIIEEGKGQDSPGKNSPGPVTPKPEVVAEGQKVAQQDPSALERVTGALTKSLGDVFDSDQLITTAVMYLGSRALGYSHGGSMRWAMKQHMGRAQANKDAKTAAAAKHDERVFDLAKSDKFSPDSVKEYSRTGDVSKLKPKTGGVKRTGSQPQTFYDAKGKAHKLWEYDGPNGKYLGNAAGAQIPDEAFGQLHQEDWKVPGTKAYNARVNDFRRISEDQIKSLRTQFGGRGETGDGKTIYATDINPATQAGEISKWAAKNNVNAEDLAGLVESAYHDALNDERQDGKKVRDLTPYLNNLVVRKQVGNPDIFKTEDGNLVSADKLAVVNDVISRQAGGADVSTVSNQYYNAALQEWNKLGPEGQKAYNNRANDGENGFYVFIANDLGVDNRMAKK